ncbi:MAG: SEC-C domain-containing protein [Opitutae bacterium]|nr:SEC-C domain-containing protein [Opitutae bacterium]
MITQQVVNALDLKPTGMTRVHHAHGTADAEQYLITLKLPSEVGTNALRVTKGVLGPGADMLIGMDVIAHGDFSVTNYAGQTKLSFRIPSCGHVDYVASVVPKPAPVILPTSSKVGRNDPCPCGSGKKFKHCHGK